MSRRSRVRRKKDSRIFSRTASSFHTKRINLAPRIMRGGIRL